MVATAATSSDLGNHHRQVLYGSNLVVLPLLVAEIFQFRTWTISRQDRTAVSRYICHVGLGKYCRRVVVLAFHQDRLDSEPRSQDHHAHLRSGSGTYSLCV